MKTGLAGAAALANAFLSAPFEADGWDAALKRLAGETRSSRAQLIAFGGPRTFPFNWVTDPMPGFNEEFASIEGGSAAVNWRVACAGTPLELAWEHHYEEAGSRLKGGVYDEFADRYDIVHGCQTVLFQTPMVFYGLATLRSRRDGATTEADRSVFAEAAPHVRAAVRLQQALEHRGAALIAGTFEAMDTAVFVCDQNGHVQALTCAAETRLRKPGGLRLIRNKLVADRPDDDRALQSALRCVLDDSIPTPGGRQFWLQSDPTARHGHRCEVLPLPRREWTFGFEPRAIVAWHVSADIGETRQQQLRDLLGLTQAEAEIAILAANGSSREEIARTRGATVNTVSSQLKSIFAKADVTREAELVALVNRLLR